MVSIVKTFPSKSKQKKKPGWQKEQQEYQKWLDQINKQTTSFSIKTTPKIQNPVVNKPVIRNSEAENIPLSNVVGNGSVKPKQQYQDEEMKKREEAARQVKHATGPVYNKGNDVYLSEEMLKDVKAGITRRRI